MNFKHSVNLLAAGLGIAIACSSAYADGSQQAQIEYSVQAPLAASSLLLSGARVGDKLVVVGARGHILVSTDEGESWVQAKVPSRIALTAVFFADEEHGWAVGHDATILRTEDGGEHWERTYFAPEQERPLLDVWFKSDARTGYAVGAYGYMLKSNDGGRTWSEIGIGHEDGDPDDFHLNATSQAKSGVLFMAAEAGAAYRSLDQGETWERIYAAYEGSFFGVLPLAENSLLLFGLQGNIFRSDDGGESWEPIDIELTSTLNGGAVLKDGTVIIVGNEGAMLVSKTGGRSFLEKNLDDRQAISDVIPAADGGAILIGEMGVRKLSLAQLN